MIAQVQCKGEFLARHRGLDLHLPGRVTEAKESRKTPALGLECVHREGLVAAAARMHHMIATTAFRSLHPDVHYIECQRRVNTDAGMQGGPRLPRSIAHAGDE